MTVVSGVPAFQQVASEIRKQIKTGALAPGAQLPSMSQLREIFGVSNTVVRDALNELRRDGLVVGQRGKGVFVRDGAVAASDDAEITELNGRLDELSEAVHRLDTRLSRLEKADGAERKTRP